MQSNFIEITLHHGCSPVNLLHIFRTPFIKNTSGGLLSLTYWSTRLFTTVLMKTVVVFSYSIHYTLQHLFIWGKVFKKGPRLSFIKFTWSILEYFVPFIRTAAVHLSIQAVIFHPTCEIINILTIGNSRK